MEKIDETTFDSQVHFLTGPIDPQNIESVIKWITMANMNGVDKQLTLYINSIGGDVTDALGLIDVMRWSPRKIATIGVGNVLSAAFLVFAAGKKGQRAIGRNTSIMIHQFSNELNNKYHETKEYMKEMDRTHNRMVEVLSEYSNLSEKQVRSKFLKSTDVWITAEQMVEYGIADIIF